MPAAIRKLAARGAVHQDRALGVVVGELAHQGSLEDGRLAGVDL